MAQRITRLTTNQEIAGSNPAGVEHSFATCISQNIIVNFQDAEVNSNDKIPYQHYAALISRLK